MKEINKNFFEALKFKDAEVVKSFIEKGVDIEAKNEHGWTPLIIVCILGHTEKVKLLLEAGVDINVKNSIGQTPLDIAEERCCMDIVDLLKNHQIHLLLVEKAITKIKKTNKALGKLLKQTFKTK